jgi:hypothetical protein
MISHLVACFAVGLTAFVITLPSAGSQSSANKTSSLAPAPCTQALARRAVCEAANQHALDYMKENNLTAVVVVQDVRTGALVAFAASDPAQVDVTTSVWPLSVVKLLTAASWWQHNRADEFIADDGKRISVHEMIVTGGDNAGRLTALELRKTIGADPVIKDLETFGFPRQASVINSSRDENFWAEIPTSWRDRLNPAASYHLVRSDVEWALDLSIGENGFRVNALSMSRFLQAVGNGGVMLPPIARQEMRMAKQPANFVNRNVVTRRIIREPAALKLQAAMRDVVQRGTAKSIAQALADTRWSIGGKTGSSGPVGPTSDGWFAGLIFDPKRKARFKFATFVKHGGTGGGNAARLSADLARYLIASTPN